VLNGFSTEATIDAEALLTQPCDVLAPCAVERVIDARNAPHLQCRILAEGANGPTTPDADLILRQRNAEIFVIPDILCNAGGVIVSYFEWVQDLQQYFWTKDEVMSRLEQAARSLLEQRRPPRRGDGVSGRTAAMAIGSRSSQGQASAGMFP